MAWIHNQTQRAKTMKRVCLFDFKPAENFHGYQIETFDPMAYFPKGSHWSLSELKAGGLDGWDKRRSLLSASGLDRLYRERDKNYMRMVGDFVDRFRDFELIVFLNYNFIHPEILARELKKPIKLLGFGDDPISTYVRGIPYLWAFDGAFFISPSYIDDLRFEQAISRWTDKPVTWWPLIMSSFQKPELSDENFFRQRGVDLVYVGNPYGSKVNRLIKLKKHFGNRMQIHGRWSMKGYLGIIRGLLGKPIFPYRVTSLSSNERTALYWDAKIGFNMHFSDTPSECGNMRTYETPAHGMLMICDKASANAHARIFEPNKEAVYYDNIEQAIELIEHYLNNEDDRIRIAKAGFNRYWKNYEGNLLNLLHWATSLSRRTLVEEIGAAYE
jgi:hypothetical protein